MFSMHILSIIIYFIDGTTESSELNSVLDGENNKIDLRIRFSYVKEQADPQKRFSEQSPNHPNATRKRRRDTLHGEQYNSKERKVSKNEDILIGEKFPEARANYPNLNPYFSSGNNPVEENFEDFLDSVKLEDLLFYERISCERNPKPLCLQDPETTSTSKSGPPSDSAINYQQHGDIPGIQTNLSLIFRDETDKSREGGVADDTKPTYIEAYNEKGRDILEKVNSLKDNQRLVVPFDRIEFLRNTCFNTDKFILFIDICKTSGKRSCADEKFLSAILCRKGSNKVESKREKGVGNEKRTMLFPTPLKLSFFQTEGKKTIGDILHKPYDLLVYKLGIFKDIMPKPEFKWILKKQKPSLPLLTIKIEDTFLGTIEFENQSLKVYLAVKFKNESLKINYKKTTYGLGVQNYYFKIIIKNEKETEEIASTNFFKTTLSGVKFNKFFDEDTESFILTKG